MSEWKQYPCCSDPSCPHCHGEGVVSGPEIDAFMETLVKIARRHHEDRDRTDDRPGHPPRGWINLVCPRCLERKASILTRLDNLSRFSCDSCDEEFTADDLRAVIGCWLPVLRWLESAPPRE